MPAPAVPAPAAQPATKPAIRIVAYRAGQPVCAFALGAPGVEQVGFVNTAYWDPYESDPVAGTELYRLPDVGFALVTWSDENSERNVCYDRRAEFLEPREAAAWLASHGRGLPPDLEVELEHLDFRRLSVGPTGLAGFPAGPKETEQDAGCRLQAAHVLPLPTSGTTKTSSPDAEVADAKQLAALLGGVGVRSIRTWDSAGKLPKPIRLGGRVVWSLSEIRAWLSAGAPPRGEWEKLKKSSSGKR